MLSWVLLSYLGASQYPIKHHIVRSRKNLEAARFVFRIVRTLWNLTGTSAALLPMYLSNFKAMRWFKLPISRLRDFTRSYDKTSCRILRRALYPYWDLTLWFDRLVPYHSGQPYVHQQILRLSQYQRDNQTNYLNMPCIGYNEEATGHQSSVKLKKSDETYNWDVSTMCT